MNIYIEAHIYICIYVYVYMYNIYVDIYISTYTYMHTQIYIPYFPDYKLHFFVTGWILLRLILQCNLYSGLTDSPENTVDI